MAAINENTLAKEVAATEGGTVNLAIAQVKEVLNKTLNNLAARPVSEVVALLEKRRAKLDAAKEESAG